VVIIDSADEMNTQAANALLKMLEEPPARTTLLLISHQPSRLLPTIRSRCRELRLHSLSPQIMAQALEQAQIVAPTEPSALAALAALAAGSVGEAIRLINLDGLAIYAELVALYDGLPRLDRARAVQFANAAAGASAARQDLLFHLNDLFLARLARCGALGLPPNPAAAPAEAQLMARLAPDAQKARAWAELAQAINARITHGRAVNLDPASLLLDTVFRIQKTAT
jgi:DNA polymerase-3 subunit delta'